MASFLKTIDTVAETTRGDGFTAIKVTAPVPTGNTGGWTDIDCVRCYARGFVTTRTALVVDCGEALCRFHLFQIKIRAKFSPEYGSKKPHLEIRPNEEPIGPWIKMANFGPVKLTKNCPSQVNAGKWTLPYQNIFSYFFAKTTWPSFTKKCLRKIITWQNHLKKNKILKFSSESWWLLMSEKRVFIPGQ